MFKKIAKKAKQLASLFLYIRFGLTTGLLKGLMLFFIYLYASVCDIRTRNVADAVSVCLILLGFVGTKAVSWIFGTAAALVVFLFMLGCAVFSGNKIGGADVKFIPACFFLQQGAFALPYDLLQSHTARTMLANSEFVIMLNQGSTDRDDLANLLQISDDQMKYITNANITGDSPNGEAVPELPDMTANEAAEHFRFNDEQKAQLNELLSEKFDSLWDSLLSGGDILPSNSSHVSKGFFAWPLESDGIITSYFGTRRDPFSGEIKTHIGTDIAIDYGSPILAAADGTVVAATWHDSYGYYVKIQHDGTYSTLYAH